MECGLHARATYAETRRIQIKVVLFKRILSYGFLSAVCGGLIDRIVGCVIIFAGSVNNFIIKNERSALAIYPFSRYRIVKENT